MRSEIISRIEQAISEMPTPFPEAVSYPDATQIGGTQRLIELCRWGHYFQCVKELEQTTLPVDSLMIYSYYLCNCELFVNRGDFTEDCLSSYELLGIGNQDIVILSQSFDFLTNFGCNTFPINRLPAFFKDEAELPFYFFRFWDRIPTDIEVGEILLRGLVEAGNCTLLDYLLLLANWVYKQPEESEDEACQRILEKIVDLLPNCVYAQALLISWAFRRNAPESPKYISDALLTHPHRWYSTLGHFVDISTRPYDGIMKHWRGRMAISERFKSLPFSEKRSRYLLWIRTWFICNFSPYLQIRKTSKRKLIYSALEGGREIDPSSIKKLPPSWW